MVRAEVFAVREYCIQVDEGHGALAGLTEHLF
jgi:hypothetical protein